MPIDPQPCASTAPAATGWGVNPHGYDFPFRSPSADIRGLLVDFQLSHDRPDAVPPLRVAWVAGLHRAICASPTAGSGPYAATHDVDLVVLDANDQLIFHSADADSFSSTDFGTALRIHQWDSHRATCVAVQRVAWPGPGLAPSSLPSSFVPASAVLDARCARALPLRVSSFKADGVPLNPIALEAGYNVTIEPTSEVVGLRRRTRVTISAVAGSGIGRAPGCDNPDDGLRTINGVAADEYGNVNLTGDLCTRVKLPTAAVLVDRDGVPTLEDTVVLGKLAVRDDCKPCCDCDDYSNVQASNLLTWDRLAEASADFNDAAILGNELADRWAAAKACRESQATHMNAIPHNLYLLDIGAGLCNHTGECLDDVELRVTITAVDSGPDPVAAVVEGTSIRTNAAGDWAPYELEEGGAGVFSAFWDTIPPSVTVAIKFQAALSPVPTPSAVVTIKAEAFASGSPLPGITIKTVNFPAP